MVGLAASAMCVASGCDKLPRASAGKGSGASHTSGTASASPAPGAAQPPAAAESAQQLSIVPGRPVVESGEILANVNGATIARADLELRLQELKALVDNVGQEWSDLSTEQLQVVLEELINNELMSQDAVARGLDRSTDTQRRWDQVRRAFFMQEWIRYKQTQHEVGSAEIEKFYEDNKRGFRVPERRRLRQISVASEDQAKQALTRVLGESDFGEVAKQVSLGWSPFPCACPTASVSSSNRWPRPLERSTPWRSTHGWPCSPA